MKTANQVIFNVIDCIFPPEKLKWHDVAMAHKLLDNPVIDRMQELSGALGYPYFCWNGRIYCTKTMTDIGMTMEDVE